MGLTYVNFLKSTQSHPFLFGYTALTLFAYVEGSFFFIKTCERFKFKVLFTEIFIMHLCNARYQVGIDL